MATYKVAPGNKFFGNDQKLYVEDDVVEFDGEPGDNLIPVDDSAKAASARKRAMREAARAKGIDLSNVDMNAMVAAALARGFAERHPEAHVGGPTPGSSMSHEQNAAIAAVPEAGLSPAAVSALPSAEPEAKDEPKRRGRPPANAEVTKLDHPAGEGPQS